MNLAIFPEQGGSIGNLAKSGQDSRFVHSYLGAYTRAFEHVYYFSYADEAPPLPLEIAARCTVVPNPGYHRWLYAFLLPLVHRKLLRSCGVARVMQAYGAIPALPAKLLYGIPFVVTYGYRYEEIARIGGDTWWRRLLFRWRAALGARLADRVIVTTPAMGEFVAALAPRARIVLVPNGVDTHAFAPTERAPAPAGEARTIGYIGRLSSEKNLPMLVEAAALLAPDLPVRLLLVGKGDLHDELARRAAALGVEMEFVGVLPHDRLPALLARCDVFVLPSFNEGHPKVLIEAMACGLPCVGTDVPGIRDVLTHEVDGLLCPLTPPALAQALRRVLTDSTLAQRLGAAARATALRNYSIETLLAGEIRMMQKIAKPR